MKDDWIERIWREAPEERSMSHEQLIGVLEPRVERSSRTLHRYVWTYILVQLGTLLLSGANLASYRANSVMLVAQVGVALLALAFAAHGVYLHGEVRRLERMDETLEAALRRRMAFYRSNATTWMWLAALSLAAFTFALNTQIDNVEGTYRISHPLVFVGVQIAMVFFLVAGFRIAHDPILRELRAVLSDLESQVLDRTQTLDEGQARSRMCRIALAVVLTALLLFGAWMAWRGSV